MIIVGFTFYNELDMLELHLEELYDVVDRFIIVEAKQTFRGNPKPLYYEDNIERYRKYVDKIVHIVVYDMPVENDARAREWFQRDSIAGGVKAIDGFHADDVIIICDVDEVLRAESIGKIMSSFKSNPNTMTVRLGMRFMYYNFNTVLPTHWTRVIAAKVHLLSNYSCQQLRRQQIQGEIFVENAGWHMSYFGDAKFIKNKLHNFSYSGDEYNDETRCNTTNDTTNDIGCDLFGRGGCKCHTCEYPEHLRPKAWHLVEKS